MPAEIVNVKLQQQQQQLLQQQQRQQKQRQVKLHSKQQQQQQQANCNRNLCASLLSSDSGSGVDVASVRNASNAADVGVVATAAAASTAPAAWRPRTRMKQTCSAKTASALRTVIIIMALVFSIMQQQQQKQQQQQQQQQHWPFHNALFTGVAGALHNNNNNNSLALRKAEAFSVDDATAALSSSSSSSATASASLSAAEGLPQTEATNHTFKSLAFLANTVDSVASFAPGPHSTSDGFAVAPTATDTEFIHSLPIFDFGMPRNITGRTGHTEAIIKCRVDSLHDKSVSWIRKRDLHILTVGTATYTTDKRFQVSESKDAREWTLHVKSPLAKDSGIYECQVNTEPKMSMAFQLNIIEISPDAKAIISGPPDLHFKSGSAIILNCVVNQPSVKDIGPIYWYRGEHMITPFDSDVSDADNLIQQQHQQQQGQRKEQTSDQLDQSLNEVLSTELAKDFTTRIAMESQLGDTLKSRLRISNAQTTDTGNYTCQPTTAASASVMVHVINDENPAAMQKSSTLALFGQQRLGQMCCVVLLLLALQWAKYY